MAVVELEVSVAAAVAMAAVVLAVLAVALAEVQKEVKGQPQHSKGGSSIWYCFGIKGSEEVVM